ncbi:MAG: CNNM domain-containing protein [Evtepia gabavorous]
MQAVLWPLLLQVILIALNAVFACAEIAVISVNDNKLAQLVAQGDKRALRLARLTSRPAQFLATIQIAITLSGFLAAPLLPTTSRTGWWPFCCAPGSPSRKRP